MAFYAWLMIILYTPTLLASHPGLLQVTDVFIQKSTVKPKGFSPKFNPEQVPYGEEENEEDLQSQVEFLSSFKVLNTLTDETKHGILINFEYACSLDDIHNAPPEEIRIVPIINVTEDASRNCPLATKIEIAKTNKVNATRSFYIFHGRKENFQTNIDFYAKYNMYAVFIGETLFADIYDSMQRIPIAVSDTQSVWEEPWEANEKFAGMEARLSAGKVTLDRIASPLVITLIVLFCAIFFGLALLYIVLDKKRRKEIRNIELSSKFLAFKKQKDSNDGHYDSYDRFDSFDLRDTQSLNPRDRRFLGDAPPVNRHKLQSSLKTIQTSGITSIHPESSLQIRIEPSSQKRIPAENVAYPETAFTKPISSSSVPIAHFPTSNTPSDSGLSNNLISKSVDNGHLSRNQIEKDLLSRKRTTSNASSNQTSTTLKSGMHSIEEHELVKLKMRLSDLESVPNVINITRKTRLKERTQERAKSKLYRQKQPRFYNQDALLSTHHVRNNHPHYKQRQHAIPPPLPSHQQDPQTANNDGWMLKSGVWQQKLNSFGSVTPRPFCNTADSTLASTKKPTHTLPTSVVVVEDQCRTHQIRDTTESKIDHSYIDTFNSLPEEDELHSTQNMRVW